MTELEKCMAGMPYNCHDEIFLQFKGKSKELLSVYNGLSYENKEEKKEILKSKRCGQCGCEGCSKEFLTHKSNIFLPFLIYPPAKKHYDDK